jgi:hypothetical protein
VKNYLGLNDIEKNMKILEDGEKRRRSKWIAGFQHERSMEDKEKKI